MILPAVRFAYKTHKYCCSSLRGLVPCTFIHQVRRIITFMEDYSGTPIEVHQAWQMFDRWKNRGKQIGIIFWGHHASLYTLGVVESAKNGRIQLKGDTARSSFNLVGATYKYGPMQTWPRWPSPPIIEVTALRAEFENGDYLVLTEGLTPPAVSSPALPE